MTPPRYLAAQVLYKLTPDSQHRRGRFTPYRYRRGTKPIANASQKPAWELLRSGYTVNNSTPIYSLYGIGLEDAHRADRPAGYRGYYAWGLRYHWKKKKPPFSRTCHKYLRTLKLGLLL